MITPRRYVEPEYAMSIAAELYGGRLRDEPAMVRELLHGRGKVSRRGYVMQLLAGTGWTSLPALPLIRQPVLILAGSDDPITRWSTPASCTGSCPTATCMCTATATSAWSRWLMSSAPWSLTS
jgi:hypothetical protein